MARPVIALDADGVLLDFHLAYAHAWRRVFGTFPAERDPLAYWPMDRWDAAPGVDRRGGASGRRSTRFWSSVPLDAGAVQACHRLADAGYELVCVSALGGALRGRPAAQPRALGYPIERVIATGIARTACSPKAAAVRVDRAQVFVDDHLPYFRGGGSDPSRRWCCVRQWQPELRPELGLASSASTRTGGVRRVLAGALRRLLQRHLDAARLRGVAAAGELLGLLQLDLVFGDACRLERIAHGEGALLGELSFFSPGRRRRR